jgi:hypothetical protein
MVGSLPLATDARVKRTSYVRPCEKFRVYVSFVNEVFAFEETEVEVTVEGVETEY